MGERIAGKQDRPSLIIEKLVFKLFPLIVHMSPL